MLPSFKWRLLVPRTMGDRLSVIFCFCEIWIEGILELCVILPRRYPAATTSYWLSAMLGVFLFVNVLGNYVMAVGTDTSSGNAVLPSILKPGWNYCYQCQQNSPPRAFHCDQCGKCVLKRDHHCIFTGSCVSYANQRYYLMCITYITLLTIYAIYFNMDDAVQSIAENFGLTMLLASVTPMFGWAYALTQPVSFFIAFQSITTALCFGIFSALSVYHVRIVLRGQTTHEFRRINDRSYDLGIMQNIREVLGTQWYLTWVFPLIQSPLPGDGIHFKKRGSPSFKESKEF